MEGCFVSWIEEVVKTPKNKTTTQTGQHESESLHVAFPPAHLQKAERSPHGRAAKTRH